MAGEDELRRLVDGLNDDYRLGICRPDPQLSPSKRRALCRTAAQERADAIYHKIRSLHFSDAKRLSTCIGLFHTQSRKLCKPAASRGGVDVSLQAALQDCLLKILQAQAPSKSQAKRTSEEPRQPQANAKRSRTSDGNLVDQLPVHSRACRAGLQSPATASSGSILSFFRPSATAPLSAETSAVTDASASTDAAASSDWSIYSDAPDATQELYPPCSQEFQALEASFAQCDTPGLASEPPQPCKAAEPQALEERLKNIWPRFPSPGLNEAPLAVVWEITRIAQHCGVDAANLGLTYRPDEPLWHQQSQLRAMLAKQRSLQGKDLPHASDQQAWKVALDTFQLHSRTVVLSAELAFRPDGHGPLFDLRLNPLTLSLGHRLSRRFGADRFLEVIMPLPASLKVKSADKLADTVIRWLVEKPHYFLGRSWRPFFTREAKKTTQSGTLYQRRVYFFATNGNNFRISYTRGSIPPPEEALIPTTRTQLKLSGLLEWAVRLQHNARQPVPKLFSRLALSLSPTYPTVVLERSQIRHQNADVGEHAVMNDGIGLMSRSLARKIATLLGLAETPVCFQARIGCAKGIWIIDVDDDGLGDDDWIKTYPSQRKWNCDFQDPHHRTFEVKDWPREARQAALNQQFIPVLEAQAIDGGAMRQALAEHLENGLRADLDALKTAMDHPADLRLWLRQVGQSRAGNALDGYVPFLGGLPRSDEETVAYLLDAGFDQRRLKFIQDRCWQMAKNKTNQLKDKMHIRIPQSAYLFMVADFTGTLEEGQVHVSFDSRVEVDGFCDTLLADMDVLVARAPAHLVSDVQKVRAVPKPELRNLRNVVVFSIKGKVPLADMLSGGDYDGDKAWVCWDRKIVENFQNAPVPGCVDLFESGCLRKETMTLQDIREEEKGVDRICDKFVYAAFSFDMQESLLGQCTKYKEKFCYDTGALDSTEAILLSKLVGHLVDRSKQGIIFTLDDWAQFRREQVRERRYLEEPDYWQDRQPIRARGRGQRHILDFLKFEVAGNVIVTAMEDLKQAIGKQKAVQFDGDLTALYNHYEADERWGELLKSLRSDIDAVSNAWSMKMAVSRDSDTPDYGTTVRELYDVWLDISPPKALRSQGAVQVLMEEWSQDRRLSPWALLKASATFKRCYDKREKLPWLLAGQQLCALKHKMTRAAGETAAALVQPEMWAALRPDRRFVAARAAERGAGGDNEVVLAIEAATEHDEAGWVVDDA